MRVVTNDALIKRNRTISQVSFFVAIFGLLGSFLISTSLNTQQSSAGLYFNCLIVPALFALVIFSVRMANNWVREPVPWKALQEAAKGVSGNAIMYHFIMPARHVFVVPQGVYVLFPMFQERPIFAQDDRWRMPGGMLATIFSFMRQESVGNPTASAQAEAERLQKFLDKMVPGHQVKVNPVIVFTSPRAKLVLNGEQTVPVVFAESKERTTLREYLKSQKDAGHATLTPQQIEQLDEQLLYV